MSARRPVDPALPDQVEEPGTAGSTTDSLVVAGRYEIDLREPLGSGGMAIVYRGRDLRTRRPVAVRTLRTAYRNDPGSRATFRQETRYQALANHGNIARIYDLHEEQDAPWAVMELVPGQTLRDLQTTHGAYPPGDAADLLDQVASALAHLHGRQIVHLDVKPENLIIAPDGTVKLIDFGLAQPSDRPANLISGNAFGTAAYLSPEQISGEPVGPAADIYALACVAYEVITGAPPFGGVPADAPNPADARNAILRAHLDTSAAPPSLVRPDLAIPAALDDIVLWALAKRPNERYTDVTAFARLFRGALEPLGNDATTTPIAWEAHPPTPAAPRPDLGSSPSPPPAHMPYLPPRSAEEARLRWTEGPPVATMRAPSAPVSTPAGGGPHALPAPYPEQTPEHPLPQPWMDETARPRSGNRPLRRVRRWLIRLVVVATLANLLLFSVLVVTRGAAEVFPFQPTISRDAGVTIVGGRTNVRSDPSRDAAILDSVAEDAVLTVTGNAERDTENFLWWPVTGDGLSGWVREDRLDAEPDTWLERVSGDVSGAIDGALDSLRGQHPRCPRPAGVLVAVHFAIAEKFPGRGFELSIPLWRGHVDPLDSRRPAQPRLLMANIPVRVDLDLSDAIVERRLSPEIRQQLPVPDARHRRGVGWHATRQQPADFLDQPPIDQSRDPGIQPAVKGFPWHCQREQPGPERRGTPAFQLRHGARRWRDGSPAHGSPGVCCDHSVRRRPGRLPPVPPATTRHRPTPLGPRRRRGTGDPAAPAGYASLRPRH